MKPPYYKAHLALFLVNVLYGAGHIIAKGVMPEFLTPSVFIFLRHNKNPSLVALGKMDSAQTPKRHQPLAAARTAMCSCSSWSG